MPERPSTEPYQHSGGDVGVLFLHGLTGSPASLRHWAEQTAAAGHTVSLPRLPGHGTTMDDLRRTSWEEWYAAADQALSDLRETCRQVYVASLSMGGALALLLAERRPDDVAGLVLVNPAVSAKNPLTPLAPVLRHVVRSVSAIANDAVLDIDEGAYSRTPVAAVAEMVEMWSQLRPYLDLVRCPLVIFRSATDHVVPASSTEIITRQVSSLDITEHVLANSYHVATMDHDADFIVDETLSFIADHAAKER